MDIRKQTAVSRNSEPETVREEDPVFGEIRSYGQLAKEAYVRKRRIRLLRRGTGKEPLGTSSWQFPGKTGAGGNRQQKTAPTGKILVGAGIVLMVVFLLFGMILPVLTTPLGIFFSDPAGESEGLRETVKSLNDQWLERIGQVKAQDSYDKIQTFGTRAPWADVLSVYAVIVTDPEGGNGEAVTFDPEKKELLEGIFWYFNRFSSQVTEDKQEKWVLEPDKQGKLKKVRKEFVTRNLEILIEHRTIEEAARDYGFSTAQIAFLQQLQTEEMKRSWNDLLFGIHTGDGNLVATALSQVGNVGGEPYWRWYGYSYRVEWCCIFVSWCAEECGLIQSGQIPKFQGVENGVHWFRGERRWADGSYVPSPGDLIFFTWNGTGNEDHVGIVEKVEDGYVYTIEGNWADSVKQNRYPLGWMEILGYGILGEELS